MNKALARWYKRYQSLNSMLRIGRANIESGTAYIYRVAGFFYECAFAGLVSGEAKDWQELMRGAIEYDQLAVERGDLEKRDEYPFNLAQLYSEWYLGEWLLKGEVDSERLDQSIFYYLEAIFKKNVQPVENMVVLPMHYMLRNDREHLANFWELLAGKSRMDQLPPEADYWARLSQKFLAAEEDRTQEMFFEEFRVYSKKLREPTEQAARFYLGLAKIGADYFHVPGATLEILRALACDPWN